ncbi:MAG: carbon-nitrogen hydrolase family protein [Proteobacteria bacterium]|nr:carbon-nitrogen hydrolase family protein [Pseudomonadota bacterium]
MARPLTIACLQTRPMPDFDAAIGEVLPLARRAADDGAELLCLAEYCGGLMSADGVFRPPAAPEDSHPVLAALRGFAAEAKLWMQIGSVAVDGPGGTIINRGFLVDASGAIRARYDKIHMFDIQLSEAEVYRESTYVTPGDAAVVEDTPWARIGHTICYDLRFPGLYRDLAQAGAEILTVPAAFTQTTGEVHWHVLNRARAIENGAFVVAACAHGPCPGGGACYGHSLIVDPWGKVLADGGEGPGVVMATIDLDEVAAARARIPSLSHDRDYARPAEPAKAAE